MIEKYILDIIVFLAILTASKYTLYLISSAFYVYKKKQYLKDSEKLGPSDIAKVLKVSVIVPAWNEEIGIVDSIKSLINTNYPGLEIVVVNDGSNDNTRDVVVDFINNTFPSLNADKTLLFIDKSNGGKGSALNHGIKASTGDVIITMDADTIFDKDAIFEVARYFINSKLDAAVGNVKIANSKTLLGILQQIEYTVGFYFKRTHAVFQSEYIIGGAFGVFRKNVFTKYGYFDEDIKTEDIEYSTRLQNAGCHIFYIEDAIAYTEGPDNMKGLMKQRTRWKKGRLDTFIKHRSLFFSTNRKHKRFLTHYLLPITLFYEIELLFEPLFTTFGLYYVITTGNYRPIIMWILFTGAIYIYTFIFGSKKNSNKALAFTPAYFFLSYILTFVEVYAMYTSVKLLLKKQDVIWQTWQRRGISNI